jgi:hypothetical protein
MFRPIVDNGTAHFRTDTNVSSVFTGKFLGMETLLSVAMSKMYLEHGNAPI